MQPASTQTAATEPFRAPGLAPQDATKGYDVDVYIARALAAGVKPWDRRFSRLVLCASSSKADIAKVARLALGEAV